MFALFLSLAAIVLGVLACVVSLYEQVRLRRELDQVRAERSELRSTLDRHGVFANEVAHELKNPVTAIVCAADTLELLLDSELDEGNRKTLRHIHDYGEHVLQMMQDFIDLTRGHCGMLKSQKSVVQADAIIASVVGLLSPSASSRGVDLYFEDDASAHWVHVDKKHLKQIVFNLVDNAIKFTPSGGVAVVRCNAIGNYVAVQVSDTGPGIEDGRLHHLFDSGEIPVFTPSNTPNSNGIGLALVKNLVDLEGGQLTVATRAGLGTTMMVAFPLVMPINPAVAAATAQPSVEQSRPLEGQSVLVVDPDPGVRDTVSRLVEALGGIVDGVSLATDALQALNKSSYSVVVLDESLSGPSCEDLIHLLRHPPTSGPRVVITSAHPLDQLRPEAFPGDHFIEKPLDRKSLLDSLLQAH